MVWSAEASSQGYLGTILALVGRCRVVQAKVGEASVDTAVNATAARLERLVVIHTHTVSRVKGLVD